MPLQPSTFSFALKPMPVATSFPDKSGLTFSFRRGSVSLHGELLKGQVMNATLLLNKAGKDVERAKIQVAIDAKAAQLAHELARAAKVNLKQARKLSKMARKSARKAEDRAEESSAALETAQTKLELVRERIRNEQRKNKPTRLVRGSKPVQKPSLKSKLSRTDDDLSRNRTKSRLTARKAPGPRRLSQKTVNGKSAKPAPAVAPGPEPVSATRQKSGDLNPLSAPDVATPSFSSQGPAND
jgi:hypothetical protein